VTPDEVLAVLFSGDFDRLVDESENGQVEFKGELYDLSSDWGKVELTKDVVAFANGYEDGVIVVGAKTIQPADSPFERVAEVSPIERPLVDEKQHLDAIKARCYPSIKDLTVTAYPSRADETRVLLAIAIPAQHEDDQPFLLLHPLSAEGSKVQGWLIGLPTRAVDQTDHVRASELHGWIRGGRSIGRRLDEIVVLIGGSQGGAPDATAIEPPGSDRETAPDLMSPYPEGGLRYRPLNAAIRLATEPEHAGSGIVMPTLYLAAEARRGASVPTIFHEGGVRETLESPPVTRPDGWNLVTLDHAEIVEGTHLRLTSGRRKLIEFYADGTLIAVGRFDRLLVASPYEDSESDLQRLLKVNSLALVEFVHDFVLTAIHLSEFIDPRPASLRFTIGVIGAIGSPVGSIHLPPYGVGTVGWEAPTKTDPPDVRDFEVPRSPSRVELGRAHRLRAAEPRLPVLQANGRRDSVPDQNQGRSRSANVRLMTSRRR
jgi:hypothetical protein